MKHVIALSASQLRSLDLTSAEAVIEPLLAAQRAGEDPLSSTDLSITFDIDFPREASDPRELSEIPEVRLWFIRLDGRYPWLPLYLDRESGELSRYTAMLVPHQFSPIDGIRYNPEALEIFVMGKVFTIDHWLKQQNIDGRSQLKFTTQMLGYELDDGLFSLL